MDFWLRKKQVFIFILTLILILGVIFRFVNIGKKAYWIDEAYTSLRVGGYTEYELVDKIAHVNLISQEELNKYQIINPEKNLSDTVKSLALEDSQHPPLYYVITRFWVQIFGNSITSFRSISALISLMALPSIYWLCWELLGSSLTAQIAVVLIAISPFHVLYAQEAREYSLWTVMTLLSSASLLYAMRLNTKSSWGIYTIIVSLSLYTFPTSIIVTVSQVIYVAVMQKFRLSRKFISYILALLVALIIYLPWLLLIINNLQRINHTIGSLAFHMSKISIMKTWALNLNRIFFVDITANHDNLFAYLIAVTLVSLIVILSTYSLYYLCRHSSRKNWLFIILLISLTALPIMLNDLVGGAVRSIVPRYLIPAYLGIQISVAHTLAESIKSKFYIQKLLGKIIFCLLISGSIISCASISQASSSWSKGFSEVNFAAAELINQSHRPLIVSDDSTVGILALNHELNPHTMFSLRQKCFTCRVTYPTFPHKKLLPVPEGFDVFVFNPSPELIQEIRAYPNYNMTSLGLYMWRLTSEKFVL